MHHPKPKSAPARLKSKFVKNRTNAMKEIEAWVRKDNESFPVPETSRMSGQLTDNVTEERMLKAKLWELSKERYKFLSQNTYEKKVFQDRQQRKSGFRRISSASADGRTKSSDDVTQTKDGRRTSMGFVTPTPKSAPKNARFSLLDRLDPTKKKAKAKKTDVIQENSGAVASRAASTEGVRSRRLEGRSVQVVGDDVSRSGSSMAKQKREEAATMSDTCQPPPLSRTTSAPVFEPNKSTSQPGGLEPRPKEIPVKSAPLPRPPWIKSKLEDPSAVKTGSQSQETPSPRLQKSSTTVGTEQQTEESAAGGTPGGRRDMNSETLTTDPRFKVLERTLCPLTRSKTTGDIHGIVANIESLHVRPRRRLPDAPKSKIEVKAYEFMKEKGFVF